MVVAQNAPARGIDECKCSRVRCRVCTIILVRARACGWHVFIPLLLSRTLPSTDARKIFDDNGIKTKQLIRMFELVLAHRSQLLIRANCPQDQLAAGRRFEANYQDAVARHAQHANHAHAQHRPGPGLELAVGKGAEAAEKGRWQQQPALTETAALPPPKAIPVTQNKKVGPANLAGGHLMIHDHCTVARVIQLMALRACDGKTARLLLEQDCTVNRK